MNLKTKIGIILFFTAALTFQSCISEVDSSEQNTNDLLALFDASELETNVLLLFTTEDGNIGSELMDGWEAAWAEDKNLGRTSKDPGDEICTGSGISFAKCVKTAVDGGTCVTVYKDNKGVYHAVEASCPPTISPN